MRRQVFWPQITLLQICKGQIVLNVIPEGLSAICLYEVWLSYYNLQNINIML